MTIIDKIVHEQGWKDAVRPIVINIKALVERKK